MVYLASYLLCGLLVAVMLVWLSLFNTGVKSAVSILDVDSNDIVTTNSKMFIIWSLLYPIGLLSLLWVFSTGGK